MTDTGDRLREAVEEGRVVEFEYKDHHRVVEPYCYGAAADGTELLRGYQIEGGDDTDVPPMARLFDVEDVSDLDVTDQPVPDVRPEEARTHENIVDVFAAYED